MTAKNLNSIQQVPAKCEPWDEYVKAGSLLPAHLQTGDEMALVMPSYSSHHARCEAVHLVELPTKFKCNVEMEAYMHVHDKSSACPGCIMHLFEVYRFIQLLDPRLQLLNSLSLYDSRGLI